MDIDLTMLRLMEREREIPFDELVGIIEQAILTAYLKHTDKDAGVGRARRTGPQDRARAASSSPSSTTRARSSARPIDSPDDFGRISAFAAKQVINQRLRDIGDDKVLGEFRGREGDIVAGVIQQGPNPRMIHIDLGSVEAILPPEEQVPGEDYTHGTRIRVYVTSVSKGLKGPSDHGEPHASRAGAQAVRARGARDRAAASSRSRRLAREAGHRTKIAVRAHAAGHQRQGRVHRRARPARARGDRRAQRREDRHRRLRPTTWRPSSRTRSRPAKVTSAFVVDESTKAVRALVPDYQLSLAIGKEGQNARLAAKLTGARIDIQPDSVMED